MTQPSNTEKMKKNTGFLLQINTFSTNLIHNNLANYRFLRQFFCDNDNCWMKIICKGEAFKLFPFLMCIGKNKWLKNTSTKSSYCLLVMGTLLTVRSDITNNPASWQQQNKCTLITSVIWKFIRWINSL